MNSSRRSTIVKKNTKEKKSVALGNKAQLIDTLFGNNIKKIYRQVIEIKSDLEKAMNDNKYDVAFDFANKLITLLKDCKDGILQAELMYAYNVRSILHLLRNPGDVKAANQDFTQAIILAGNKKNNLTDAYIGMALDENIWRTEETEEEELKSYQRRIDFYLSLEQILLAQNTGRQHFIDLNLYLCEAYLYCNEENRAIESFLNGIKNCKNETGQELFVVSVYQMLVTSIKDRAFNTVLHCVAPKLLNVMKEYGCSVVLIANIYCLMGVRQFAQMQILERQGRLTNIDIKDIVNLFKKWLALTDSQGEDRLFLYLTNVCLLPQLGTTAAERLIDIFYMLNAKDHHIAMLKQKILEIYPQLEIEEVQRDVIVELPPIEKITTSCIKTTKAVSQPYTASVIIKNEIIDAIYKGEYSSAIDQLNKYMHKIFLKAAKSIPAHEHHDMHVEFGFCLVVQNAAFLLLHSDGPDNIEQVTRGLASAANKLQLADEEKDNLLHLFISMSLHIIDMTTLSESRKLNMYRRYLTLCLSVEKILSDLNAKKQLFVRLYRRLFSAYILCGNDDEADATLSRALSYLTEQEAIQFKEDTISLAEKRYPSIVAKLKIVFSNKKDSGVEVEKKIEDEKCEVIDPKLNKKIIPLNLSTGSQVTPIDEESLRKIRNDVLNTIQHGDYLLGISLIDDYLQTLLAQKESMSPRLFHFIRGLTLAIRNVVLMLGDPENLKNIDEVSNELKAVISQPDLSNQEIEKILDYFVSLILWHDIGFLTALRSQQLDYKNHIVIGLALERILIEHSASKNNFANLYFYLTEAYLACHNENEAIIAFSNALIYAKTEPEVTRFKEILIYRASIDNPRIIDKLKEIFSNIEVAKIIAYQEKEKKGREKSMRELKEQIEQIKNGIENEINLFKIPLSSIKINPKKLSNEAKNNIDKMTSTINSALKDLNTLEEQYPALMACISNAKVRFEDLLRQMQPLPEAKSICDTIRLYCKFLVSQENELQQMLNSTRQSLCKREKQIVKRPQRHPSLDYYNTILSEAKTKQIEITGNKNNFQIAIRKKIPIRFNNHSKSMLKQLLAWLKDEEEKIINQAKRDKDTIQSKFNGCQIDPKPDDPSAKLVVAKKNEVSHKIDQIDNLIIAIQTLSTDAESIINNAIRTIDKDDDKRRAKAAKQKKVKAERLATRAEAEYQRKKEVERHEAEERAAEERAAKRREAEKREAERHAAERRAAKNSEAERHSAERRKAERHDIEEREAYEAKKAKETRASKLRQEARQNEKQARHEDINLQAHHSKVYHSREGENIPSINNEQKAQRGRAWQKTTVQKGEACAHIPQTYTPLCDDFFLLPQPPVLSQSFEELSQNSYLWQQQCQPQLMSELSAFYRQGNNLPDYRSNLYQSNIYGGYIPYKKILQPTFFSPKPGPKPASNNRIPEGILSDHGKQIITYRITLPSGQSFEIKVASWNLLDKCFRGKQYANNPWNNIETPEEYRSRKERQIEVILKLLDEEKIDCFFLQEIDFLAFSEEKRFKFSSLEQTKIDDIKLQLQTTFLKELAKKGFRCVMDNKETQKPMATLLRESSFTLEKTYSEFPDDRGRCQIYGCQAKHVSGLPIDLINVHFDWKSTPEKHAEDICTLQSKSGSTISIIAGDHNKQFNDITKAALGSSLVHPKGLVTNLQESNSLYDMKGSLACYDWFVAKRNPSRNFRCSSSSVELEIVDSQSDYFTIDHETGKARLNSDSTRERQFYKKYG